MRLLTLSLRNFKGCRSSTLEPNGEDLCIYGDNATFKTTHFDAFTWLMFGKDSANKSDFDIKTLNPDGQPIHGLEHEVEAVLEIGGRTLTLRRLYKEKWAGKKNSLNKTFDGHTTDYFIDGVPLQKKEYVARIADIVDEDVFKLLTNPKHFNEVLGWQKRREILLEVCGDITDADVIASDKDLAKLPEILGDRKLEDHRKVIKSRQSKIRDERDDIPIRIGEVDRGLPQVHQSPTVIQSELTEFKEQRASKEQEIVQLEAGGGVAQKQKRIVEIETEMLQLEKERWTESANTIQAAKVDLRKLTDEADNWGATIKGHQVQIEGNDDEIQTLKKKMDVLRSEFESIELSKLVIDQSDVCPTCNQPLPAEQIEAAREKACMDFNRAKSDRLENIKGEGLRFKATVEAVKEQNADLIKSIEDHQQSLTYFNAKITGASSAISLLESQTNDLDFDTDSEWFTLQSQKGTIQSEIEALHKGTYAAIETIRTTIHNIDQRISEHETIVAQLHQVETGQKRILELKAEEENLSAEFERLEFELNLTDKFVVAKVGLLEGKINSKFKHARFKMFDVQVNGEIDDKVCETLYEGVPYNSSLNNGARINVGLDIINTLSEHYKFDAPIFADNAESVTALLPTKGQQIKLYVNEADKVLRVV